MSAIHTGGCRCGKVRFECRAEPHFSSYCHCEDCRRATGAPVLAYVGFRDAEIDWSSDESRSYGARPVSRFFCPHCGSPLGYRDDRLAGRTYFYTGIMDEPERFPPAIHAYSDQQLRWLKLHDDLPRVDKTSVERPSAGQVQ